MERREIAQLVRTHMERRLEPEGKKEYIVAANWKMNMSAKEIKAFLKEICDTDVPEYLHIIIFPPFPYLPYAQEMLRYEAVAYGAQDVAEQDKGAYTGEISAAMLADCGCSYTLAGHSERRAYYGETSDVVARKASKALEYEIVPVICIGETLEERRSGAYKEVLKGQIEEAAKVCKERLAQCIIAYEPVWAIGTGVIPTIKEIGETHRYIHDVLASECNNAGGRFQILYGGSVNESNVKEIASVPFVDGFLAGGASLKAESFKNIIKRLSLDGCL
ncbi:triose-phosphate isomerase [Dorea sp. D27]|uniref:triose-phosphate isomerase n=1 Tax=Dorea sp. D27 TaxID=658665 RepID=UPI0006735F2E|nr:triose-phosphate isomerase [Dorea sp. D27]